MQNKVPQILVSHPTGNRNARAVIEALEACGSLHSFHTSIAFPWKRGPLRKRSFPIPFQKIHSNPIRELCRQVLAKYPNLSVHTHETGFCCVDKVYESLDRKVAKQLPKLRPATVYCYEDGALHTFEKAKSLGIPCIYELPIAYGRTSQQLLKEEAIRHPSWAHTLKGTQDSEAKMMRKEKEIELADLIICPSEFVRSSIPQNIIDSKPVAVIPYGTDSAKGTPMHLPTPKESEGPLQLLYVGILTQRKGLADLFEAIKRLKDPSQIELHLVGKSIGEIGFYENQGVRFHYHGTLPRDEVLRRMQESDVFVLPSIVEGRALVQLEALSQGLPLIITTNTGGEDLINEAETGFMIEIRQPDQIAAKLEWFLENREKLSQMQQMARKKASEVSWASFQNKLLGILKENLSK